MSNDADKKPKLLFPGLVGDSPSIRHLRDLFAPQVLPDGGVDLRDYLKSTEAALIHKALSHSNGIVSRAASLLQIGRTTLTEKIKRLGLSDCLQSSQAPREYP